jgi:hypothetical protein
MTSINYNHNYSTTTPFVSIAPKPPAKKHTALIATESYDSLANSRLEGEQNRYKVLWIKKIEEIAELKKEISMINDTVNKQLNET